MKVVPGIVLAFAFAIAPSSGVPATPVDDQTARPQDSPEFIRLPAFERRDREELNRRGEQRSEQWRAEETARAETKSRARSDADHGDGPDRR